MRKKLEHLLTTYGPIALLVYYAIFGLVLCGFAVAIDAGLDIQGVAGTAGTWAAAYVATKVTQPARIIATVVLTPLAARLIARLRGKPSPEQAAEPPADAKLGHAE